MKTRRLLLVVGVILLAGSFSVFAGAQSETAQGEEAPAEFTVMYYAYKEITEDDVAKDRIKNAIEDKLNVKFNVVMRTYESHAATHENLAAEMAAGTAMDYNWAFVGTHMPVAAWQKWLRDGLVVNIGEYVAAEPDRYPVLTELFKDPYWRLFNYKNNNGVDNNYAMWSAIVQKAPRGGIVYNGSMLKGLGLEKPPETYEDFIQTLRDAHEKYDVPAYGWIAYNGVWWGAIGWHFFEPQGKHIGCTPRDNAAQRFFQRENGDWYDAAIAPENKAVWKELQGYVREGLFNPTWLTEDWYQWTNDKWPADQIFCGDVNWTQDPSIVDMMYTSYKATHPDAKLGVDVIVGETPLMGPGGNHSKVQQVSLGYWGLKFIPFTTKQPDRLIDVIEYLMSDDGRDLQNYGVKGVHWTKDDKSDWNVDEWAKDFMIYLLKPEDARTATTWPIFDPILSFSYYFQFEKYGYYGALERAPVLTDERQPMTEAKEYSAMLVDKLYSRGIYDEQPYYMTLVQLTEDENFIEKRLTDIRNKWWSKFLSDEADVDATWDEYVAEYKAAGVDKLVAAWSRQFGEAKSIFDELTTK